MALEKSEITTTTVTDKLNERDIYYQTGFIYARDKFEDKTLNNDVALYMLFVSFILFFLFFIIQIFTLLMLFLFITRTKTINRNEEANINVYLLIGIFAANVSDHLIASLQVLPGQLLSEELTIFVWIFEIIWIILFGIEVLIIFQPVTNKATEGSTLTFGSSEGEESLISLYQRVNGTKYEVEDIKITIDIILLRDNFVSLIKYLISISMFILLIDLLIWEIMSRVAGGSNLNEAYFVSGLSLILYILIIAFIPLILGWNEQRND